MQQILVIGFVYPEPTSAAGTRMLQLIKFFRNYNFKVTFATAAQKTKNSYCLKSMDIAEIAITLNSNTFDDFILKLKPHIVLFDRFMIEEQYGWRVAKNCAGALRILNTEDLHALRKSREKCIKNKTNFTVNSLLKEDITKREIASIYRCDLTLLISSFEIKLLKNTFKIEENILLHLPFLFNKITEKEAKNWMSFESRNHFITIGNFLHAPNVDSVVQLKKNIWQPIKEQLSNVEMHVYGAYPTQQIVELHNEKEGFLIKGFVENAALKMQQAKVCLAPIRFGAGVKGKLMEAMQNGTPSITTNIGAEGIGTAKNWNGFVEDDFYKFAQRAIDLYTNKAVWQNAQKNGIKIINSNFEKEKLEKIFIKN